MALSPVDIQTAARDLYNATGDTFFSDAQINNWMWQACHELAKKAYLIERIYSTTTVAGQQDYAYPANTIAIKRVTYNGKKIKRLTHRGDDAVTLSNQSATTSGSVIYYTDFNYTISCRPIPDSALTLQIYSFNDAQAITNTSILEIPVLFQFDLVDYILFRMYMKDKDPTNGAAHKQLWDEHIKDAISYSKMKKRSDSFATVQDEETLPVTIMGEA